MNPQRRWKLPILLLLTLISMSAVTKRLIEYAVIDELYQGRPCRYGGELSERVKLAIEHLRKLPDREFCNAILFKTEPLIVKAAVQGILLEVKQETAEPAPCKFCLWLAANDLEKLEYDFSDNPALVEARDLWKDYTW